MTDTPNLALLLVLDFALALLRMMKLLFPSVVADTLLVTSRVMLTLLLLGPVLVVEGVAVVAVVVGVVLDGTLLLFGTVVFLLLFVVPTILKVSLVAPVLAKGTVFLFRLRSVVGVGVVLIRTISILDEFILLLALVVYVMDAPTNGLPLDMRTAVGIWVSSHLLRILRL